MMINYKENMRAALECRQPETAVPIWELEFQAWDIVSGKHIILGTEFTKLSPMEQDIAIHSNAEIMIETSKDLHFAALTLINSYWEVAPGKPSYYWLPQESKNKQNILLQKYCEQAGIMTVGLGGSLITMPGSSDDYTEFCYRIIDEPEELDKLAKIYYENGLESAKFFRNLGCDIMLSPSDIADNRGPFFSPEQMERWFYPYLYKWADAVKTMGMYSILHTDGNVNSLLEKLADSPLNALQAIDPVAGMDIEKAKQIVAGKLCLCGNVETGLLFTGPTQRIYENTKNILESCKSGGGLVLGASNASVPETPRGNYKELIRAWEDFGKY
jgi:uroporphyrinogen decarboxylase